jgi:hypothetical protein
MPRKTFIDGDVLPASDLNNFLMNQSVMTFATSAARATAIPTPTEGMVTYRNDVDILELYNGAAWVPAAGRNLITTQTFTSTNAINVDGVFSSLYTNYEIFISLTSISGTSFSFNYQHRQSGTTINTNYQSQRMFNFGSTITSDTVGGNTTNTPVFGGSTAANPGSPFAHILVANPFLSQPTRTLCNSTNGYLSSGQIDQRTSSIQTESISITGFRLSCVSTEVASGTFSVYGVK